MEPKEIFTYKQKADKAIHSLKGILLGINLDSEVNESEMNELYQWASNHKELIHINPFNEFMTAIQETVRNKIPTKESIEDLYWLTQKYEGDSYFYDSVTSDLQILQGLLHGILSDGVINESEIKDLYNWLSENEHLNSYYPYDEIRSILLSVLKDNKVDDDEKSILKAYFKQFINLSDKKISESIDIETSKIKIEGLCTSEPNVTFEGKTFCITGVLKRGNREDLKNEISKLGGIPTDNLNLKTDYLIVGDNGNSAWAFSCYGRKVEKAVKMRKEGHTITLIHEFDFADIIDDLK